MEPSKQNESGPSAKKVKFPEITRRQPSIINNKVSPATVKEKPDGEKKEKSGGENKIKKPGGKNEENTEKPVKKQKHKRRRQRLHPDSDEEKIDNVHYHKPMYGRPMADVDYSVEKTFCVIAKKFGKHYVCRFDDGKSMYLFSPLHPLRKFAIYVVTHPYFHTMIIFTILCNCVTIAMTVNQFNANGERIRADYDIETDQLELVFLAIYISEMILKIMAKGFAINKFSYLRSYWNVVDFVVVCAGVLTTSFSVLNLEVEDDVDGKDIQSKLQFLRLFRILRAVKTVSVLPGLRTMINALLSSAVQLLEVMTLNFFCLMIFALFGLEMYMGKLDQKCVLLPHGIADSGQVSWDYSINQHQAWYIWINNPDNWAQRDPAYPKEEPQPCGNGTMTRACNEGYVCLQVGESFDDGWTSFDNIFLSMLATFQLLTTDFWERPYELVLSSSGPGSIIFFLVLLFFGSFYLLNLMLAVVAMSYETEAIKKELGSTLTKLEKLSVNRASSTFSFDYPYKLNLQMVTAFRCSHKEDVDAGTNTNDIKRFGSFTTIAPKRFIVKGKGLGDAILGILGRRVTLHEQYSSKNFSEEENTAIEIDAKPRPKFVKSKEQSGSESGTETESVYSRMDQSDNYPSKQRSPMEKHIRLTALVLRRKLRPLVCHAMFDAFITVSIMVNTLLFALEHHGMNDNVKQVLEMGNHFFMAVFTAECLLKLLALQKEYFVSRWNLFDIFIVVVSFIDATLSVLNFGSYNIRSFRLLRIFKLTHQWTIMKVLLNIVFATFGALGNLVLLLTIVIYIFAVLGMQVIGGEYSPNNFAPSDLPRWNFKHFFYSFMIVFRIICGEWNELLLECLQAEKNDESSYKCFLIFFPIVIIGNYVVLNLFLALLLDSFDTANLKEAQKRELVASGKAQNLKKIVILLMLKKTTTTVGRTASTIAEDNVLDVQEGITTTTPGLASVTESAAKLRFKKTVTKIMIRNRVAVTEKRLEEMSKAEKKLDGKTSIGISEDEDDIGEGDGLVEVNLLGNCLPKKCMEIKCAMCIKIQGARSKRWDRFRLGAAKIVGHWSFEWSILAFIFFSSITLCFEDIYLEKRQTLKDVLFYLNCVFCVIFIVEMLLKWFAIGLWGYCCNQWCILDFFIVVISVITLYFDIQVKFLSTNSLGSRAKRRQNFAALKALRTLRALRPLRAISRWEGMKIIVNALMYAIPLIFNVFLVCLLFWLIFSIMGVQLFQGKFYKCLDGDGYMLDPLQVPTRKICCAQTESQNYSWVNVEPNFDNVLQGYFSLLQIATFEGWMELMSAAIDAVDVDYQPKSENEPLNYIFFVIFIVFGAFFTLNLFIGVMVDNFGMLKKKYEGNLIEILLTPNQRNYLVALKKLGSAKPRRIIKKPNNKFLCIFYDLALSRRFEIGIFAMIFLNLLVISVEVHNASTRRKQMIGTINSFFTAIYVMEAFVKILGLRFFYFKQIWNVFDFVLVIASLIDLLMMESKDLDFPIPPTMLRVVRVIRIGRVLRLVKSARGIRKLLNALVVSLPALGNIGALIALITFIYAILGMASFSGAPKYGAVDQIVNWDTFWNSCVVLVRLMLAAGWNDILESVLPATVLCGSFRKMKCGLEGEPDCPSYGFAITYFISYILIVFLIIINMYTAIILENYEEASQEEEGGISDDDLDMFYMRWARYDPQATQFVPFDHLSDLLASLDPPFFIRKPNIVAIVAFNLPICRGNKIHCLDVLHALVRRIVGELDTSEEFRKLEEKMEHRFQKQFPNRKLLDIISSTRIWKMQINAAITIQRAWRAYYRSTHPHGPFLGKSTKSSESIRKSLRRKTLA